VLRGSDGLSLVEILVAAFITGAAVVGLSLMFATGSVWVSAMGDDRVAAGLAQRTIEQIRANPQTPVPSGDIMDPADCDVQKNARCGQNTKYLRVTSVECVDDSTPAGLATAVDCPSPSDPLKTKRITVSITPIIVGDNGTQTPVQRASAVTLQGWISPLGR
jgi:Tfp pilus assembly protein PilV